MNHFFKIDGKRLWLTALSAAALVPIPCYGHFPVVHETITGTAYQSSDGLQTFVRENLTNANAMLFASQPQAKGNQTASNWLTMGSRMEDDQKYGIWGALGSQLGEERSVDHFYTVLPQRTPGQVIGLTDWSVPPGVGKWAKTTTTNSFKWATDDTVQGPYKVATNVYQWSNARQYEFAALTSTNQYARDTNMASLFYTLGHILHLNQDLTSPDHVRNDDHVFGHYFENYGLANYTNNSQWFAQPTNHGWAYWQVQGFTNLLNFWDTDTYAEGSSLALNRETNGSVKLGLAEWSNGNFLGERALYMECYNPSNVHHFPYPRKSSTDYPGKPQSITVVPNGRNLPSLITNYVVTKTRDGVAGFRHSILSYMGTKFPNAPTSHNTKIENDGVLQDYHDRLIPKAVEYSTGILDYFFRGTMDVTIPGYDTNALTFTNVVLNTSGQDFHGGTFFMFADATNGTRTLVLQTNLSNVITNVNGIFTNGTSVEIICSEPISLTNKYLLVYQGTIGWTNDAALDLVDSNICIAAARPWVEQIKTYEYHPLTNDVGTTITTNLESDDFPFDLTTNGNYEVIINMADFDDKGTIGSISPDHYAISYCENWVNEITSKIVPAGDISIDPDNHRRLRVAITATDDPYCGGWIGWYNVSITWRAWPAPE